MTLRAIHGVLAPAKLNLFLHIVGRRDDGYHLLQSVFRLIDWYDVLHFDRNDSGRLTRHDLGPALPPDDLCLRAAAALRDASGTSFGADITLDKCIPTGAGMGGGSSDAASTLLALNRLWGLDWPLHRLLPLALKLGADVPFFCAGHDAWVGGIGEQLAPISLPPCRYVVVKPGASVQTGSIFTHPDLTRDSRLVILGGGQDEGFSVESIAAGAGRNDLQPVAQRLCPEIVAACGWLHERFGQARMTGSGSAVFARLGPGAAPASVDFDALPDGWTGRLCGSMATHPLSGWSRRDSIE